LRRFKKNKVKTDGVVKKEILMLRLQAFERMILLLERISPGNMVMRLKQEGISSAEFYQVLVTTLRSEFDHNIAQQLYISHDAWQRVVAAREEILAIINSSYEQVDGNARSTELLKKILENSTLIKTVEEAKLALKKEAAGLF